MDGDDRFKFEKSGRMTLQADVNPTIYLATGGVTQAFMQVQGNNLHIQATSNKVHINNDLTVDDATWQGRHWNDYARTKTACAGHC